MGLCCCPFIGWGQRDQCTDGRFHWLTKAVLFCHFPTEWYTCNNSLHDIMLVFRYLLAALIHSLHSSSKARLCFSEAVRLCHFATGAPGALSLYHFQQTRSFFTVRLELISLHYINWKLQRKCYWLCEMSALMVLFGGYWDALGISYAEQGWSWIDPSLGLKSLHLSMSLHLSI